MSDGYKVYASQEYVDNKKFSYDELENKPFYTESTIIEDNRDIIPLQEVDFMSDKSVPEGYLISQCTAATVSYDLLVYLKSLNLTIDGTTYLVPTTIGKDGALYFGNLGLIGLGEATSDPFFGQLTPYDEDTMALVVAYQTTEITHTISLSCIDDTIPIIEEGTYTFKDNDGNSVYEYLMTKYGGYTDDVLRDNDVYNLTFNGVTYENITWSFDAFPYLGNLAIVNNGDDTGENYFIWRLSDRLLIYTSLPAGDYTVSLETVLVKQDEIVHKIDSKYLPDEIETRFSNIYTKNEVDNKVTTFHATISPVTTEYIKDSADFTYADVVATENCKIEATYGNIRIILNKEVHRNVEPADPIAGRYVEFSALMRSAGKDYKIFLFVYDPEALPTDEVSASKLETWGDSQYCSVGLHTIVLGEFLDKSVSENRGSDTTVPSTKAIGDYTDSQCGVVLDYMQTTFADNIMALCNDRFGPHVIYDNPTGFEASNDDAGDTWHLTGLDLSPYKRIKCYVCSGGDGDSNYSPQHIVEVHLDDRAKGSFGYFTADHAGHCPDNRNRHHMVTFTVNAEKTAIQFQHSISMYGTSASDSVGGRRCYLIEGYYI